MGLFPIICSHLFYRLIERYLPKHFFVSIFVTAFLGAGLVLAGTLLLATMIVMLGDIYSRQELSSRYLPFMPLMIFPEAFITGFLITIMVVMRPEWVYTFDDK